MIMQFGKVLEMYREMYGDSFQDEFECCGDENLERICCDERKLDEEQILEMNGQSILPTYQVLYLPFPK